MIASLVAAAFVFSTQPIDAAREPARLVAAWTYDPELTPDNLVLNLKNPSSSAACIPRAEVEGSSLLLFQGGKEVDPVQFSNRAILVWRGADLASGLTVIPPGKSVTLFYNLRDWTLAPGPTEARLQLPHFDCLAFFQSAEPSIVRELSTYQFTAHLTQSAR